MVVRLERQLLCLSRDQPDRSVWRRGRFFELRLPRGHDVAPGLVGGARSLRRLMGTGRGDGWAAERLKQTSLHLFTREKWFRLWPLGL